MWPPSMHRASRLLSLNSLCPTSIAPVRTLTATAPAAVPKPLVQPLFKFGVIADVQWADTEDGSNFGGSALRRYRGAFRTLVRAVDWWASLPVPPAFIAQLGDIIDGVNSKLGQSETSLAAALAELRRAPCPVVNLVGNPLPCRCRLAHETNH